MITFRRISIGYSQTTPSYDHPGRKWVMSSVETTGGYKENGATSGKFSNAKGDSLAACGARLAVPAGAMSHGMILSITPLDKNELPHLPARMVNVTVTAEENSRARGHYVMDVCKKLFRYWIWT